MNPAIMDLLRCPATGDLLQLENAISAGDEVQSGTLVSTAGHRYPIVDGIPRFVGDGNYASNFGFQWNRFRETQLDSRSGQRISHDRFFRFSKWDPSEMANRWVLDVGCGAGRFTEIALATGANVVAVDYSSAVDACWANHRGHPRLHVVQGDISRLPFSPGRFDYAFCLGVLQHTPQPREAFMALPRQLVPGGRLVVDIYPWMLRNVFWSKYWLRPFTKSIPPEILFSQVERLVRALLPLSRVVGRIPLFGRRLTYLLPIVNYDGVYPLSRQQLYEWAVLDTFDMLSPAHDHPQTLATMRRWMREAKLHSTSVERIGFIVARGER
jgi:SAM-dependent methyltransferase